MKSNNVKSFLPPITNNTHLQNNNSRSPTNISKEQKEKSDNNNNNKFPNIKSINNSQEIKKIEKNEDTNQYIEEMKKGTYNILVCVRCRPLSSLEYQLSTYETIRIMDNKMVILMDPIEYNGPNTIFKNRSREQTYAFDFAFDKYSTQNTVFEKSTKFLIEGVVNGYNATVFAYGATGAGKTYTMLGTEINPGIMPLTLKELFNKVKILKTERQYKLKFWYLEIYNENIRDLLRFMNQSNNSNNNIIEENESLDLREDPIKGIIVSGITEVNVNNSNDMLRILKRGNRNRTQEATGANETSSRSHAILQVAIEYKDKNSGIDFEIKYSKLSLIDLAGSERASATQNRGIRLIEGANINRSLLTLGNCINALCDAAAKGIKKPYVPYRDSKLTRLLKDSLGGNARTVMIANVSPSINAFDDTYNTLKYANRAKNIKTMVTRNVLNAQYHISNYVNIINALKNEVNQLKNKLQLQKINNLAKTINANNTNNEGNSIHNSFSPEFNSQNQTKESFNTNIIDINNNNFNDDKFSETVKEIKKACDCQVSVKQKIISNQNEINKLSDIIEMNKNITSINNNLSNLISFTGNKNSKENSPNSLNENNNNQESNDNSNNLNEKINELKNNLSLNQNRFLEFNKIIEKIYKTNSIKNNYSDLQKDFLSTIIKNSNYKLQMLDIQYKNILIKAKNDIKNEYIKELEKQIKYRDDLLKENNIDISAKISTNNLIKELDNLRKEYKQKLSKNFHSNFMLFYPKEKYHSIYCTNPNRKNFTNFNICPNSNISNLNKINIKYNSNNSNTNMNNINNIPNQRKQFTQSKFIVIKNESNTLRPGSKGYPRQLQLKNKALQFNKNLKRNNKSYAYKEPKAFNKGNESRKNTLNKKDMIDIINIAQKHNKSFNEEDNFISLNRFSLKSNSVNNKINKNNNEDEGRFITFEEMPHVKKRELNFLLNERNKKRQKFLDKINAGNKDLL